MGKILSPLALRRLSFSDLSRNGPKHGSSVTPASVTGMVIFDPRQTVKNLTPLHVLRVTWVTQGQGNTQNMLLQCTFTPVPRFVHTSLRHRGVGKGGSAGAPLLARMHVPWPCAASMSCLRPAKRRRKRTVCAPSSKPVTGFL